MPNFADEDSDSSRDSFNSDDSNGAPKSTVTDSAFHKSADSIDPEVTGHRKSPSVVHNDELDPSRFLGLDGPSGRRTDVGLADGPLIVPPFLEDRRERKKEALAYLTVYPNPTDKKMSVEAWIRVFESTVDRLSLDENAAIDVLFRKIANQTWAADHQARDKKHKKQPDLKKWLTRLRRAYASKRSTRMHAVRARQQGADEDPITFVNDVVDLARQADSDLNLEDLIALIEGNIHPKWKPLYSISKGAARTPRQVQDVLAHVMSDAMKSTRAWMEKSMLSEVPVQVAAPVGNELALVSSTPKRTSNRDDGDDDHSSTKGSGTRGNGGGGKWRGGSGRGRGRGSGGPYNGFYGQQNQNQNQSGGWSGGQSSGRGRGRGNYSSYSNNRQQPDQQQTSNFAQYQCNHCGLMGHIRRQCPYISNPMYGQAPNAAPPPLALMPPPQTPVLNYGPSPAPAQLALPYPVPTMMNPYSFMPAGVPYVQSPPPSNHDAGHSNNRNSKN